jgi:chaperone modulatory protein CbpM
MMATFVRVTVSEICEKEGLSRTTLSELVEYEIARPLAGSSAEDWQFDATGAHWMKRAARLRRDLDIDWITVAAIIDLLRQREELAQENQCLRQQLERFLAPEER